MAAPSANPEASLHPVVDRLIAVVLLSSAATITVLLLQITPDPRGHGSHEQLGMLPCSWPEVLLLPCPTCGFTTAACHLVHLQPLRALQVQPFGAVLAAAGIGLGLYAGWCLLRGRSVMRWLVRLPYGTILLWTILLFLAAWGYKYLTFAP